jgi:hypothetical protein
MSWLGSSSDPFQPVAMDCNHNYTADLGDEVGCLIGALLFRQFLG